LPTSIPQAFSRAAGRFFSKAYQPKANRIEPAAPPLSMICHNSAQAREIAARRLEPFAVMVADLPPQLADSVPAQCANASDVSVAHAADARRAGRFAEAAQAAQCVLSGYPDDADAWFELGAAKSALGARTEARQAYLRALDLAPANDDARLGLARLAWWDGDAAAAQTWLASVSDSRRQDPEVLDLQKTIADVPASSAIWRADIGLAQSTLTQDLPDWKEVRASLFRRDGDTGFGLALEHARRFEREDLYIEAQATHQVGPITWSLALGGTPKADFRPETSIRLGAETSGKQWQVAGYLSRAEYAAGPVAKLDLRAVRNLGDTAQLFLQGGVVNDENGENHFGYGIGANWRASSGLTLDAGWSDSAESSDGATVEVKAFSAGATFEISETLRVRTGVTREMRDAYDRTEASLALARTF
jgi:tetratricopeptide (TPR) repeat protein